MVVRRLLAWLELFAFGMSIAHIAVHPLRWPTVLATHMDAGYPSGQEGVS